MVFIPVISVLIFCIAIARGEERHKGTLALLAVIAIAIVTSWFAAAALSGSAFLTTIQGGRVFGEIVLEVDRLSAWFILLTNFTFVTGILYGKQYLKKYSGQPANLSLHYISYILNQSAIMGIYFIRHGLTFLCTWEIMALSSFILMTFENWKMETLKAGINYLIQSHIGIVMLTLGFILVYSTTGSFDFSAITRYSLNNAPQAGMLLFLLFFIGFAIKAGFVPFHTWLPRAHPAAPSHISGLMSGVIIKTGIYGILRMLLLLHLNYLVLGYSILILSVITGIYGVMMALVQHNIKKLLAYHTIENIGIIGMGIGIGCIGTGLQFPLMTYAGYGGALLHTLNHSLFKSLLFYEAGSVYQATGTSRIDRLGGLIHSMPKTAYLFLIASLAICGLPPFNGFISEFLVYSGLYNALGTNSNSTIIIILSIAGLALIGGLALFCFTKAFGIIFLGNARSTLANVPREPRASVLLPGYFVTVLIISIGIMPGLFMRLLNGVLAEFTGYAPVMQVLELSDTMRHISFAVWGLLLLIGIIYLIRMLALSGKKGEVQPTWGCGYSVASPALEYTASSFVRSYTKLIRPILETSKAKNEIREIIPETIETKTHYYDKLELVLIDRPVKGLRHILNKFRFLQNGSVQFYLLYGAVFIALCVAIPLFFDFVKYLTQLIKQL